MYRVLVTGSRTWADRQLVYSELDKLLTEYGSLEVMHGYCRKGADLFADEWVTERSQQGIYGIRYLRRPADWVTYKLAAGRKRNQEMVDEGAGECLAFFSQCMTCARMMPHDTHGSADCARRARAAQIHVTMFRDYFGCPRCLMVSRNPNDIREGYCGHCHDWTGLGAQ